MAGKSLSKSKINTTKKEDNKINETISNEINIDELVAKKVAELLAQKQLELVTNIDVKEVNNVKKIKPSNRITNRKFVPDNTLIRLEQSIDGKFIIADNRGSNFFIEMNGYGANTTMSFKDLKNYHGKYHSFLNKGKLKIIDVVSESGDVGFEDVIQDLNLQGIYDDENKISPLDIEYYLLEEDSLSEFSNKVRNSREILETIIEVSSIFYNQGKFNDNSKMDVLRQVSGNYDLYKISAMPSNVHSVKVKDDMFI
jgi:hypothetical protein